MIDIARRVGVSRMAVSAVLMGTGQGRIAVSPETAERIRNVATELNYRPNRAAQLLAGRRSDVIAIIAQDWKNHLTQVSLSWLHEAAEEHGYRILSVRSSNGHEAVQHLIRDVRAGWVAGLVYLAYLNDEQWPEIAATLSDVPNAIIAVGDLRVPGVPSVISDVAAGTRDSVAHLAQIGRKKICFITEEITTHAILARIHACAQAATEFGLTFDAKQDVIVETQDWMLSDPKFHPQFDGLAQSVLDSGADALLCDTDYTAVGLIKAFQRLRVSVPNDIAVIGWGNLQCSVGTTPLLTTVSYELPMLLSRVVLRLEDRMEKGRPKTGSPGEDVERIAPRLVIRNSA